MNDKTDARFQAYADISHGTTDVMNIIKMMFNIKRPILIQSSPGLGKTSIWRAAAKKLKMNCLVLAPCNHDSIDLKLPYIDTKSYTVDGKVEQHKIASYAIGSILPREQKTMLLVDDLGNVPPDLQASLYSLVNEGSIGSYKLPEGSYVGAASNRTFDKTNCSEISAALKDRFWVVNMHTNKDEWLKNFGYANNVHPAVVGYLHRQGKDASDPFSDGFDALDPCGGFTARSLEALSNFLNKNEAALSSIENEAALFKGIIGRKKGQEFADFYSFYKRNINIVDILEGKPFDVNRLEYTEMFNIINTLIPLVTTKNSHHYADFLLNCSNDVVMLSIKEIARRNTTLDIIRSNKKLDKFFMENHHLMAL